MADTLGEIKLVDILPPSIVSDPKVLAAAKSLDREMQAVTEAIEEALIISQIDKLPEKIIALLAWQWHVDFYEPLGLSLKVKRELVKQSYLWHRRKGTPGIVEEAIKTVFGNGIVREWFEYDGRPYFFRVESRSIIQDIETFERIIQLIYTTKNTRSWLESIRIIREKQMPLYYAHVIHKHKKTTLYPNFSLPNPQESLYLAHVKHTIKRTTLYPALTMPKPREPLFVANIGHIIKKATIYPPFIAPKPQETIYSTHVRHVFKKTTFYPKEAIT